MIEPKVAIERLCIEKYKHAKAVFWAGSVSTGNFTSRSDLDLVIVMEHVTNAYREAFAYEGWKIDTFIHDFETLHYFFDEVDGKSGIPSLPQMVLMGKLMTLPSPFVDDIRELASNVIEKGPLPWSNEQIDRSRFHITDVLDDIVCPQNRSAQVAAAAQLYEFLAEFYFRANGKWHASGKAILSALKKQDYDLASLYRDAFDEVFKHGHASALEILVQRILAPFGGLIWEGYRAEAPIEWRK